MSSFLRLFAAGVIVVGVGALGSTEIELALGVFTDPGSEVRADNTLSSVGFGPGAANEKDGQVDPEAVDLRSQVALLRSDLAEVQQLRRLDVAHRDHQRQVAFES